MTAAAPPIDLRPLGILASSIAGRSVEVAPAEPGARTWTDGCTIFLEAQDDERARLRLLGAQASLLAAGSLRPEVVRHLRRHRPLALRYLAVEGQRALAANAGALPPWMRWMIDRELAGAVDSAEASLARARRDRGLVPAWELGTLVVPRLAASLARVDESPAADPAPSPEVDVTSLGALDEDDDGLDLGDLLTSPVGGGGPLGRLLARLLRPTRAGAGGGPAGADAPTHGSGIRSIAGTRVTSLAPAAASVGDDPGAGATHWYPEWDHHWRVYRPDWCQVIEDTADAASSTPTSLPQAPALRRALAPLGTGRTPCRRRPQGDDVDLDALVEARADRLAGSWVPDDVYVEHLRRRRDLAVLVLLDVSGSAAEPGVAGRSVHDHQRDAAAALATVLHDLGDRVALHAFSSSGRKAVRVTTVTGFGEPVDGTTAQRLGGLRPGGYTRLGAAIRHGSRLLEDHGGTTHRLLVVLSDGLAYDHGYEHRHGEADARRALVEARRRGIGCLCLSVGGDIDAVALRRVFGTAAHAAVPTADQLAGSIGPLFAAALQSAEAQRMRRRRAEHARARLHGSAR